MTITVIEQAAPLTASGRAAYLIMGALIAALALCGYWLLYLFGKEFRGRRDAVDVAANVAFGIALALPLVFGVMGIIEGLTAP